jgi:molybdopterin/thiamine biosynthesis adenylyltransferase
MMLSLIYFRIAIVRGGELRLDDMNRQILMTDDWVGKTRVTKAQETLSQINPDVVVDAIAEYVNPDNVDALVQRADIALSCAHNFPERDLMELSL